jgi:hypothetical protein
MTNTIEVFVPTAEAKIKKLAVNPRIHDLNGKVLGFLWNEKPNGDILLKRLREQITQKYKLARTEWGQIDGLHVDLKNERVLNELAEKADTAVIAVCD